MLDAARRLCDELLDMGWKDREAWVYQIEPLEESLARAKAIDDGPVVLLDHYDNSASGGTGYDDRPGRDSGCGS